jgi:hypothetical protein
LKLPKASQVICTLRAVSRLPTIPPPNNTDESIRSELSTTFQKALATHDVDTAFKLWSQELECVLHCALHRTGQQPECKGTARRGQILFHEKRTFPKTVREHASTLQTRKLWKAYCQIKEILVAAPGTRRDRAIANLSLCYPGSQIHLLKVFKVMLNLRTSLQLRKISTDVWISLRQMIRRSEFCVGKEIYTF